MLLARVYLVNNSSNHIFGFLCVSHFSKWLNSLWSFVESSLGCSGVFFFFFFSLEIAFLRPLLCMSQPSQPSNDLWISWRIIFLVPNRQNYSPHHASSCTRFISDFFSCTTAEMCTSSASLMNFAATCNVLLFISSKLSFSVHRQRILGLTI